MTAAPVRPAPGPFEPDPALAPVINRHAHAADTVRLRRSTSSRVLPAGSSFPACLSRRFLQGSMAAAYDGGCQRRKRPLVPARVRAVGRPARTAANYARRMALSRHIPSASGTGFKSARPTYIILRLDVRVGDARRILIAERAVVEGVMAVTGRWSGTWRSGRADGIVGWLGYLFDIQRRSTARITVRGVRGSGTAGLGIWCASPWRPWSAWRVRRAGADVGVFHGRCRPALWWPG